MKIAIFPNIMTNVISIRIVMRCVVTIVMKYVNLAQLFGAAFLIVRNAHCDMKRK